MNKSPPLNLLPCPFRCYRPRSPRPSIGCSPEPRARTLAAEQRAGCQGRLSFPCTEGARNSRSRVPCDRLGWERGYWRRLPAVCLARGCQCAEAASGPPPSKESCLQIHRRLHHGCVLALALMIAVQAPCEFPPLWRCAWALLIQGAEENRKSQCQGWVAARGQGARPTPGRQDDRRPLSYTPMACARGVAGTRRPVAARAGALAVHTGHRRGEAGRCGGPA